MVSTNFQDGTPLYAQNLNAAFSTCADISGGAGGGLPNTTGYMTGTLTVNNITSNVGMNTGIIVANTRLSIAGIDIGSGLASVFTRANNSANASDLLIVPTTQQTANFTLSLANTGTMIEVNSANIITCTIPNDGTLLIPNNTIIELCQIGTSSIQIQGVTAVTVQTPSSNTTRTQFSAIGLRKRSANIWILSGDLT